MNQFRFPNTGKVIKNTSSGLIGKLNIKNSNSIWELFSFRKLHIFSVHLETGHFSYQYLVDDKPDLQ